MFFFFSPPSTIWLWVQKRYPKWNPGKMEPWLWNPGCRPLTTPRSPPWAPACATKAMRTPRELRATHAASSAKLRRLALRPHAAPRSRTVAKSSGSSWREAPQRAFCILVYVHISISIYTYMYMYIFTMYIHIFVYVVNQVHLPYGVYLLKCMFLVLTVHHIYIYIYIYIVAPCITWCHIKVC